MFSLFFCLPIESWMRKNMSGDYCLSPFKIVVFLVWHQDSIWVLLCSFLPLLYLPILAVILLAKIQCVVCHVFFLFLPLFYLLILVVIFLAKIRCVTCHVFFLFLLKSLHPLADVSSVFVGTTEDVIKTDDEVIACVPLRWAASKVLMIRRAWYLLRLHGPVRHHLRTLYSPTTTE